MGVLSLFMSVQPLSVVIAVLSLTAVRLCVNAHLQCLTTAYTRSLDEAVYGFVSGDYSKKNLATIKDRVVTCDTVQA